MRGIICFFVLCSAVSLYLCGCSRDAGTEGTWSAEGDPGTGYIASGGSVVTESAVSGEAILENPAYNKKSSYCNANGYYEKTDTGCVQRKPDGTLVREISFGANFAYVCFVTDCDIFYVKYAGDNDEELWSVPIERTEDGDQPQEDSARFILKDEAEIGWGDHFYATEDYIVYINNNYELKAFDRKEETFLTLKGEPMDKKCKPNNVYYMYDCVCGSHVFFQCKYEGLYMYTLGSDTVTLVDSRTHGAYSAVAYGKENQIIYERCDICEDFDEGAEGHHISLYLYDCETGKRQEMVTEDALEKICEENGLKIEYLWESMYIDEDVLYSVCSEDVGSLDVFSLDLDDGQTLRYEKEFSDWLKKSKYDYWDILDIENGKCFIIKEEDKTGDEYISGYYDLKENQWRKTPKVHLNDT